MKRTLYAMPAVMAVMFYGMLAILVGGFGGFEPIAWLTIILPVLAALLLLGGRWWGCIPGMLLGGLYLGVGLSFVEMGLNFQIIFGALIFAYYLVMGILSVQEKRKKEA